MPDTATIPNWPECFGKDRVTEFGRQSVFARGGFGEVSLGLFVPDTTKSSRLVAIKALSNVIEFGANPRMVREDVLLEIAALRELSSHDNIVGLLAVYQSNDSFDIGLNVVLEYCPVDLYVSLEWRRKTLQPLLGFDSIRTITKDVFAALHHCHTHHYLHRDLKPGNLLVSSAGRIKLCDFGLTAKWNNTAAATSDKTVRSTGDRALCTIYYRSPEMLLQGRAGDHPSVDIYAAGVILAELVLGATLLPGQNVLDQVTRVFDLLGTPEGLDFAKECQLRFQHQPARDVSDVIPRILECDHAKDFLEQCLVLDPQQRATASAAVQHPFLQCTTRTNLQFELIPRELDEPFVFSQGSMKVAKEQAIIAAGTRKSFLAKLDSWPKQQKSAPS